VSFMAMGVLALVIALATHGRLGYTGRWSSEPRARERGTGRPRLSAAS
jgi:hypothetical protein